MRRVRIAVHLAAVAVAMIWAPHVLSGQQADQNVGAHSLADFAQVHIAINAVRDAFHTQVGRLHDDHGRAAAREELARQVADVLARAGMTQEEFSRFTLIVSIDPERRAAFDALVAELSRSRDTGAGAGPS